MSAAGSGYSAASAGALVTGVAPGSPAATAGLSAGSTITSVAGQTVTSAGSLATLMKGRHGGDRVTIGWTTSAGVSHTAVVTLMSGPAD